MIKRLFDVAIVLPCLMITGPLMLLIVIVNRLVLGPPVLFRQPRPGLHGKPFIFYKFRTMTHERDEQGELLPDEDRLTPFGKFLRSTSLDELPSLFNVLKGDMSMVGPRPLLIEYLPLYNNFQKRRHDVKPGITGWVQVNGRNSLSWQEKFEKDIWYVENQSFWLDLKILFLTVVVIFKRDGISAKEHQTMPKFRGTGDDE
ncbi:MAG: sugar transferase [Balneolaceae bacterium]